MRVCLCLFTLILCLSLTSASAQDLNITPGSLDFSRTCVNSFSTLTFTLENVGVDNFPTVTLMSADSVHFRLNWALQRGEAMTAIGAIRGIIRAVELYRRDYGEDPLNVRVLVELQYLVIPDSVLNKWHFSLIGNPIVQFEAVSTAEMPYGADHVVLFDYSTGRYSGFATPWGDPQEPAQVQEALGAIYNAVRMYRQDFGEDPASVEELLELEYLTIPAYLLRKWTFNLIGANPISQIEAVSTDEMIDGGGHVILFDVWSGLFSGFRIPCEEFYDWLWGDMWCHNETLTMSVTFRPDEERRYESEITMIFKPAYAVQEVFSVPLIGEGVLSVPDSQPDLPSTFAILSAYPNPFNSVVTVDFSVDCYCWGELSLYNLLGERVARLYSGKPQIGVQQAVWKAAAAPSGCYYLRLESAGRVAQQGVTLVK